MSAANQLEETARLAHTIAEQWLPLLIHKGAEPEDWIKSLSALMCWDAAHECCIVAAGGRFGHAERMTAAGLLRSSERHGILQLSTDGHYTLVNPDHAIQSAAQMRSVRPGCTLYFMDFRVTRNAADVGAGSFPIQHVMIATGGGRAAGTNNPDPIPGLPLHGGEGNRFVAPGAIWQEVDLAASWDAMMLPRNGHPLPQIIYSEVTLTMLADQPSRRTRIANRIRGLLQR